MSVEKPTIEYAGGKEELPVERYEAAIQRMVEEAENGEQIGFGKTGNVVTPEGFKNVCAKIVKNKEISCNKTTKEMQFLDQLNEQGFPVPAPVFSVETTEYDYLGMEKIHGVSVKDILEDKTGEILKSLPETFDLLAFFEELKEVVERMHEEARVYHRDLHEGNIMIDFSRDCRPTIIDFGDATKQFFSEENPYRTDSNTRGVSVAYTDDNQNVIIVRRQLVMHFKERGRPLEVLKEAL